MCILCLDSPMCTPTESSSNFKDDSLFQYLKVKCECAICLERMVDAKTLKCQHSFCKDCLDDVITVEEGNIVSISCPVCRQPTRLSFGETLENLKCELGLRNDLDTFNQRYGLFFI